MIYGSGSIKIAKYVGWSPPSSTVSLRIMFFFPISWKCVCIPDDRTTVLSQSQRVVRVPPLSILSWLFLP